jgi:type VI secretion system FHA domain protein
MSLLISIIKAPDSVTVVEPNKTFDAQGGSIGRGRDNTWILEDPERYLSSLHCQISCENGQFYIIDKSTNGTFYNGSRHPIGKGARQPVNDGDAFAIGDYEFALSLSSAASFADPFEGASPIPSSTPPDEVFSAIPPSIGGAGQGEIAADPFVGGHLSDQGPLFGNGQDEADPLAALDKAQGGYRREPSVFGGPARGGDDAALFGGPAHLEQADPLSQQVSWPEAVPESVPAGGIPDDWNNDAPAAEVPVQHSGPQPSPFAAPDMSSIDHSPPRADTAAGVTHAAQGESVAIGSAENQALAAQNQALAQANQKLAAELEALKQELAALKQRTEAGDGSVDTSLVDTLGFQRQDLTDAQISQLNQLVGEVVREMIGGLMQVLGSRNAIKKIFRMNVTTIQPVENNPLKFSANIDDALENMFLKKGNAYKQPVEAVQECFESVAEHQVAVVAGIRAAFKGVVERFDPVLLDARFSRQNKGSFIPGSQKAKNWDLYIEYYNELIGDIDKTFQFLFGDDFVRAYEEHLQGLVIKRKSDKSKDIQ